MAQSPSDHDENQGVTALSDALMRSISLLRWLMLLLLFGYLFSGVFILKQHEKAVVLRLGKIVGIGDDRVLNPGFHWTWPRPFSEVIRIPAGRVRSLTSTTFWHGYPEQAGDQIPDTLRPMIDGYTLAGDANLLHSQWTIRYTIENLEAYLFGAQKPEEVIERELNRAALLVSAQTPIDALIRTDLEGYRLRVDQETRRRLSELPLGIAVQGVDLLHVSPPPQVAAAFDQVIRAEQEQAEEITDARAYAGRILNEARGEAEQTIAEGETFKTRLVSEIKADADYFREIQPSVARQPDLMRQVIWQDAIRKALGTVGQLYVVPSDADGRREIRLQLSPRRENPFAEAAP